MYRIGWLIMIVILAGSILINPCASIGGFLDPPYLLWCVGLVFGQMLILRGMCGSDDPKKKQIEWYESWRMATVSS